MCGLCDANVEDITPVSPYTPEMNKKMDPTVKKQWLTNLRSGNFKQGKNKLRKVVPSLFAKRMKGESAQRYCCLGVLCKMYGDEHESASWEMDSDGEFRFYDGNPGYPSYLRKGYHSMSMPTSAVFDWAAMEESDMIYLDESDAKMLFRKGIKNGDEPKVAVGLAELNDAGIKFPTIANLIEKYL